MSHLVVYKASAGSGKTYKLTEEYLKRVFRDTASYKNILGVTFTNKASGEMKKRILSEIHKLAINEPSSYLQVLTNDLHLPPLEIQFRAQEIRENILHDFSRFAIGTIDSFFQYVIRSFAKDLGLSFGFSIELDSERVLRKATDRLLQETETHEELHQWIIRFAESKVEQGKSWNFYHDIMQLGMELFKEQIQQYRLNTLPTDSPGMDMDDYVKNIQKEKAIFENTLQHFGQKALDYMGHAGLSVQDFSYGSSGVAGFFEKITKKKDFEPGKRVYDALSDSSKWVTKNSDKKDIIISVVEERLLPVLQETLQFYETNARKYFTSITLLKYLFTLGILHDISRNIREVLVEENVFLLADAPVLINKLISENDAPFIYERIGNVFTFFMIDEFQDTSKLQWNNFKPLIRNGLSEGYQSLVVGDVKQSIYRWRNSDWTILSDKIHGDIYPFPLDIRDLQTNWRSQKNVVDFNNAFFTYVIAVLKDHFPDKETFGDQSAVFIPRFEEAYKEIIQHLPYEKNKSGGFVQWQFFENSDDKNWKDQSLLQTLKNIEKCQRKGIPAGDMAILVRKKSEGKEIADFILQYKNSEYAVPGITYDILSEESLYVDSCSSVRLMLAALSYLVNPKDDIARVNILAEYFLYLHTNEMQGDIHELWTTEKGWDQLPYPFINGIKELLELPLYELGERLFRIFRLEHFTEDIPYIQAFFDVVKTFSEKNTSDLHSFTEWWKTEGIKQTIKHSEEQDAIRILTIHKSKGLEFGAVFLPFCNWKLDHESLETILWCKTPDINPFSGLSFVPVRYGSGLENTYFRDEYYHEKLMAYVDHVNLLYVAFTRAKETLFIGAEYSEKKTLKQVGDLLKHFSDPGDAPDAPYRIHHNEFWQENDFCFSYGSLEERKKVPVKNPAWQMQFIHSAEYTTRLKVKKHSAEFNIRGEAERSKLEEGKIMHRLFQQIYTLDDIENAVMKIMQEGVLTKEEARQLVQQIRDRIARTGAGEWFSGKYQVKTEPEIWYEKGSVKRPDRVLIRGNEAVVIDFKFGESERNEHVEQVLSYCKLVQKMGYSSVRGHVWYVSLEKIVDVYM